MQLARLVLGSVGQGWANRVFYSDNGSTAVEVALKMAFRKYMVDRGMLEGQDYNGRSAELEVRTACTGQAMAAHVTILPGASACFARTLRTQTQA